MIKTIYLICPICHEIKRIHEYYFKTLRYFCCTVEMVKLDKVGYNNEIYDVEIKEMEVN